jgi:hypothetical protein
MKRRAALQLELPLDHGYRPMIELDPGFEEVRRVMRLEGFARPRDHIPMIGLAGQYAEHRPARRNDAVIRNFNRKYRKR